MIYQYKKEFFILVLLLFNSLQSMSALLKSLDDLKVSIHHLTNVVSGKKVNSLNHYNLDSINQYFPSIVVKSDTIQRVVSHVLAGAFEEYDKQEVKNAETVSDHASLSLLIHLKNSSLVTQYQERMITNKMKEFIDTLQQYINNQGFFSNISTEISNTKKDYDKQVMFDVLCNIVNAEVHRVTSLSIDKNNIESVKKGIIKKPGQTKNQRIKIDKVAILELSINKALRQARLLQLRRNNLIALDIQTAINKQLEEHGLLDGVSQERLNAFWAVNNQSIYRFLENLKEEDSKTGQKYLKNDIPKRLEDKLTKPVKDALIKPLLDLINVSNIKKIDDKDKQGVSVGWFGRFLNYLQAKKQTIINKYHVSF